jgi:hypothetical protein
MRQKTSQLLQFLTIMTYFILARMFLAVRYCRGVLITILTSFPNMSTGCA